MSADGRVVIWPGEDPLGISKCGIARSTEVFGRCEGRAGRGAETDLVDLLGSESGPFKEVTELAVAGGFGEKGTVLLEETVERVAACVAAETCDSGFEGGDFTHGDLQILIGVLVLRKFMNLRGR